MDSLTYFGRIKAGGRGQGAGGRGQGAGGRGQGINPIYKLYRYVSL